MLREKAKRIAFARGRVPMRGLVAHLGSVSITNSRDTFLECAQAMNANSHICFLVVGDEDLREMYRNQYAHLSNLTFAPRVQKEMVHTILSKCDLLYFSAHISKVWQLGQSLNKVIDDTMAERPVVASYTGFPSTMNEAECGSCYLQVM